ncbi:MAG: PCRF domain-containing protein, partial [Spirochaetales bacterium]|nr:PCRF domain-containing protein [Spirochaetales bacterium]
MALDESIFSDKTIEKLDNTKLRYEELTRLLSDVNVINDMALNKQYSKEYAVIEPLVAKYNEYNDIIRQYHDSEELIADETDKDLISMAEEELDALRAKYESVTKELRVLLIPPDPMADKDIIMEIRAGTGGEEAALFCGELFRMYSRYAEKMHWKVEILDSNETEMGGYKEIVFSISGKKVYENMRFEYGGHRVQRIPVTETNGRVHTSAVTVAVLPEAEEADVEIRDEDLRIDVCRSGGAGG